MMWRMTIMTKINQIWSELANDKSFSKGLLFRRYSGSVLPDVYIALQVPEQLLCIYISINESTDVNTSNFVNLQEIQVEIFKSPFENLKNILIFKLLNFEHKDIFAVLCEDLIANIANETNEKKIIKLILNRFEKWKSLFNKIKPQGLSPEEQRGLYGELTFIKKYLQESDDYEYVIDSWVGSEKQVRDFQNNDWAVEVKTTHGNNHQKVQINNERQLDLSNIEKLYLYHISLEQLQNTGESLNELVDFLSELLSSDMVAFTKFKSKLYEVGYFDFQRNLYDSIGYLIRQDVFYEIENEFPRIEEKDIRIGVGDVKYSIILSQCIPFIIDEQFVFETIKSKKKEI